MSDSLFYIVKREMACEPFVNEFLFGQYERGERHSRIYQKVEEGESVRYNKNVAQFPKIVGMSLLVFPTDLMLDLRETVVAKSRKVEFTSPFDFPWSGSGFDVFENFIEAQELRCREKGVGEFQIEFEVNNDPDLAYLDFVDQHRMDSFELTTNYWEMIPNNSTISGVGIPFNTFAQFRRTEVRN